MAIRTYDDGPMPGIGDIFSFSFSSDLVLALVVSFAVCVFNIATERWHGCYSLDSDTRGVQKVHKKTVGRTGGLGLFIGVLAVVLYGRQTDDTMLRLLIAAIPAFLSGIVEDLTKAVTPRVRLYSILASACLAIWLLEAPLPRLGIWGLDGMMDIVPVAIAITAFSVAGVTNSINIIDGFHGVAGMSIVIILGGMGFLAWREGDQLIVQLAAVAIGTTIGFLILNYPTGRLFMGDGGAYFLGFWAAEIAVLMVVRNSAINTWQILAIYSYPVIEVLFSIYRRKIIYGTLAGAPDRLHLHSLFYRRFARKKIREGNRPWICNAGVACFVATWIGTATCISVMFGNTVPVALALVLGQVVLYIAVYMRLVRGHWGHCRHPAVVFGLRPQPRHPLADGNGLVAGPRAFG